MSKLGGVKKEALILTPKRRVVTGTVCTQGIPRRGSRSGAVLLRRAGLETKYQWGIELTAGAGVLPLDLALALPEHPGDGGAEGEVML